jgi:hypothetical protein
MNLTKIRDFIYLFIFYFIYCHKTFYDDEAEKKFHN